MDCYIQQAGRELMILKFTLSKNILDHQSTCKRNKRSKHICHCHGCFTLPNRSVG